MNDSVVTNQMLYFSRFVADIDFANLALEPAQITAGPCDAWAMKSEKLIFGWVVNPRTSVANESFTISGLPRRPVLRAALSHLARRYLDEQTVECRDGKLTVTIPELKTTGGLAANIGHDVAFKISPK